MLGGSVRAPGLRAVSPHRVISGATRSYEIVEPCMGRAGLSIARQHGELGFNKLVAIKTLPSGHVDRVHALVLDEARLRHVNIASTLDVVVEGDAVHVVMEYVEGPCVADLLRVAQASGQKLPAPVTVAIVHDVLLGLEHAHGAHEGLLQCAISPEHVIVGFDGLARIVDVGLEGTRQPEIYACGWLLWHLLQVTVLPPKVASRLDAVIACATNEDPRARYETPGAMAKALRDAVPPAHRVDVADVVLDLPMAGAEPEPEPPNKKQKAPASLSTHLAFAAGAVVLLLTAWAALHL
jgi:serine/threonine protein kinase